MGRERSSRRLKRPLDPVVKEPGLRDALGELRAAGLAGVRGRSPGRRPAGALSLVRVANARASVGFSLIAAGAPVRRPRFGDPVP